ncbi:MAG: N-acetylmuramic acid 6-phosphate etherase [Thermodesulfobacteriota bacterium]|nr:N-acetylmuramic acid 6-phosphate etherase [Thermodesulfobacteriota bacterium]
MVNKSRKKRDIGPTEKDNPNSAKIDSLSALKIAKIINREDQKIALIIRSQLKSIARAIEIVQEALAQGGRLFYVGAGTSGRLGVLDAAECPPTFSVSPADIQGIIAGGKRALWRSVERAEDDFQAGVQAIRRARVRAKDVVCGISASGKTTFVQAALTEAKKKRARCIFITCHPSPKITPWMDVVINPVVGPEVIAGSTRMKAGTATKMVLNMISTGAMVRLGKVYGNLMVDVKPVSAKLKDRAERIITSVLSCSRYRAKKLLQASKNRPKVAIVMGAKGLSAGEAERLLKEKKGFLREAL